MLENNMVINATAHDPQCQPYAHVCDICGDGVNEVTVFASGDKVCDDCKPKYIEQNSGEFVDEFVYSHQREYYKNWHFDNLPQAEQDLFYKKAYMERESFEMRIHTPIEHSLSADRVEFCLEHDNFARYVEERLT